jgi:hypothetical protein
VGGVTASVVVSGRVVTAAQGEVGAGLVLAALVGLGVGVEVGGTVFAEGGGTVFAEGGGTVFAEGTVGPGGGFTMTGE